MFAALNTVEPPILELVTARICSSGSCSRSSATSSAGTTSTAGQKAGRTFFVIILPFLGIFIYPIEEGKGMGERNVKQAHAEQAEMDDYVRSVAGNGGSAEQIAQAKELLVSGTITQSEFDALKAKALATKASLTSHGGTSVIVSRNTSIYKSRRDQFDRVGGQTNCCGFSRDHAVDGKRFRRSGWFPVFSRGRR
jgi:hypothetical protein